MKYAFLLLFLTACATTEAPPVVPSKTQAYDLSDHAKSGRAESRSYVKVNQPIRANHPLSRK